MNNNKQTVNLQYQPQLEASVSIPKLHILSILIMGLIHGLLAYFLVEKKILQSFYFQVHIVLFVLGLPFMFYSAYLSMYYKPSSFKKSMLAAFITISVIVIAYCFFHASFLSFTNAITHDPLAIFSYNSSYSISGHHFIIFCELIIFVGLPLLLGMPMLNKQQSNAAEVSYYQRLFSISWCNIFSAIILFILTGLSYGLVYLSAYLFKLIGIEFFIHLLKDVVWFNLCLLGILTALNVILIQYKSNYIDTMRKYWLGLCSFFFYFIILATIVWLCAIPFTGLDILFKTKTTTIIIISYMLLYIKLLNSIYENGQDVAQYKQHKLLKYAPFFICSLLALWLIGIFAVYLRTKQYALTMDRIDAWIVLSILGIYAFGYSLSIFKRKVWLASLEKTNIFAAIIAIVVMGVFSLGFIPFKQIIINSQINALLTQKISIEKFDFAYLRSLGDDGVNELKKLANLKNHPKLSIAQQLSINTKAQDAINYTFHEQETTPADIQMILNNLPRYAYQQNTQTNINVNIPYNTLAINVQKGFENHFSKNNYLLDICKKTIESKKEQPTCILWQANLDVNNTQNMQWYLVKDDRMCGFSQQNTLKPLHYDQDCEIAYDAYSGTSFVDSILKNTIVLKNNMYVNIGDKRNINVIHNPKYNQ
jgi:hypothetical protein